MNQPMFAMVLNILAFTLVQFITLPLFAQVRARNIVLFDSNDTERSLFADLSKIQPDDLMVINFASSVLKPSHYELPELVKLFNTLQPKGMHLWIILSGDDEDAGKKIIGKFNIPNTVQVLPDELESYREKYGIQNLPQTIVIDKSHRILYKEVGYSKAKFENLKKFLEEKLK